MILSKEEEASIMDGYRLILTKLRRGKPADMMIRNVFTGKLCRFGIERTEEGIALVGDNGGKKYFAKKGYGSKSIAMAFTVAAYSIMEGNKEITKAVIDCLIRKVIGSVINDRV